jgi:hypothetical protein
MDLPTAHDDDLKKSIATIYEARSAFNPHQAFTTWIANLTFMFMAADFRLSPERPGTSFSAQPAATTMCCS